MISAAYRSRDPHPDAKLILFDLPAPLLEVYDNRLSPENPRVVAPKYAVGVLDDAAAP